MILYFTHKRLAALLNFNNLDLLVSCEILERERERERERDASSVIIKQKILLCQNDEAFFYALSFVVYLPKLIYILSKVNRQDKACTAVLLFCCRSESASSIYLSDSRFHHAVKCILCTLLLSFLLTITRNINNK